MALQHRSLIAASLVISSVTATAVFAQSPPNVMTGASYSEARSSFLHEGWKPVSDTRDPARCSIGREDICDQYPEAEACAGTGMGNCLFVWGRGKAVVEVGTVGEDIGDLKTVEIRCRSGCSH